MSKSRGSLLVEWSMGTDQYRLIAVGKHTAGYEDIYVIEQLGTDSLGEPCWERVDKWDAAVDRRAQMLVGAVKAALGMKPAALPEPGPETQIGTLPF